MSPRWFVAQDVRQHGPLAACESEISPMAIRPRRAFEFHTGVHQGQRAGADGSHRRRTVRLEDVRYDTHGVGFSSPSGTIGFRARHARWPADLAGGSGRVRFPWPRPSRRAEAQHELLGTSVPALRPLLSLSSSFPRTERNAGQRLRFTAREDRRAVRCGQVAHLAPDRTDPSVFAAVEALLALVGSNT